MRTFNRSMTTAAALAAFLTAGSAWADTADVTPSHDTYVRSVQTGGEDFTWLFAYDAPVFDVRQLAANSFVTYIQFDLSNLDIATLNDATLTLYNMGAARNDFIVPGRFSVHGLPGPENANWNATNTPQDWIEGDEVTQGLDFSNAGFEWTDDPTIGAGTFATNNDSGLDLDRVVVLDPEIDPLVAITEDLSAIDNVNTFDGPVSITGQALVDFITERVGSSDNPGKVTFLTTIRSTNRGYGFASKEFEIVGEDPGGDYNESGQTEQGDLDLVLGNWGLDTDANPVPAAWTNPNQQPDGLIDQAELDAVLLNWGATTGGGGDPTPFFPTLSLDFDGTPAITVEGEAVPEPATLALLGLGGLAMRRRRA